MICLDVKISEEFVRVILRDWCWFVHIQLVRMVNFKFLAKFPVDHFSHPVMSRLILLRRYFATFAYYVIDFFRLSHHIIHIYCFVVSYLFLL